MKGYRRTVKRSAGDLEQWGKGGSFSLLGIGFGGGERSPSPVDPDEPGFDWSTCKRAWAYWRERLIEHFAANYPGQRPWAFWVFDCGFHGEPSREEQARYLKRHGLLTEREKEVLKWREREAAELARVLRESDKQILRKRGEG